MNPRDNLELCDRLIFACDYGDIAEAMKGIHNLRGVISTIKIGMQMFTKFGPHAIQAMKGQGFKVWLDLKFMDIPNTVAGAVESAQLLGVDMLTIHLFGGGDMIEAAVKVTEKLDPPKPLILGVSVLTSLDDDDLMTLGIKYDMEHQVRNLVHLGHHYGVHGIICSPQEVKTLRDIDSYNNLMMITPGIRPVASGTQDQKRVATPRTAVMDGADAIVVGRPIKNAADQRNVCENILRDIEDGLMDHRIAKQAKI